MSQKSSKFWSIFALPASLLILASAYYVRVSTVRNWIDARTPIAANLLGRFVQEPTVTVVESKTAHARPAATPDRQPGSLATSPGGGNPATSAPPAVVPAQPKVYDLQTLARDRSLWPKKVALKKPEKFPAVVNGKVVGEIVAPTGTEANLKAIKDGQVGLEFQGGGTWVAVEDTDLSARVPLR